MEILGQIFKTIINIGATALLPIIIFILGLIFRMKIGDAIKSGLTVGIGFMGLTLVVNLLTSSLKPAVEYYSKLGAGYTITDIGWPAIGAASWVAPFAGLAILFGIIFNIVLVRVGWTKTMNVDIWNYMHFLIPGSLAYVLFNNFWIGLLVTVGMSIASLFIGDKLANKWQKYFGLEGTTCTTIIYTAWVMPFAWIINKLIDFIPGLNKVDLNLDKVNKKLGVFGDSSVIGTIVGLLLALLTKQNLANTVTMGIGIASVMVLMPKMVGVLMEGISPVGKAARTTMSNQMGKKTNLNIGMDIALGLGDPTTETATVITIPLVIICALLLPNIKLFPVGLLMSIIYISVAGTLMTKGNLFRTIIIGVIFCSVTLYLEAYVAPGATKMIQTGGVHVGGLSSDLTLSEPWNAFIYWLSTII
ncbi:MULTISPECIES: PTS transporter subunit IIC [unclassified Lactobacillus]|uniref:PTS transporter subunit IIC n=1 Tax=unclassified Lactobacillus TaxID=2620435 RepID=UPI002269AC67|nr:MULTISPECIES: PTS transporter subunit IIC [unclassified Lactobacillus]MCX8722110.1 PTS galactitol transporter subunit IIC [Lactobacillus sp. B4010]MCX8732748.1 PTS galactitol transporter subunit IIC [Lactobacillus sp. B4015]MCX8734968.1 PTS galactitol transporter subunit IIC [Lactobacillus sp. B4012]